MAVKILIKRRFNTDRLQDAASLIIKARYGAMRQRGYISSETLSDLKNPGLIVVSSMWQTEADWNSWKDSPERAEFETEMGKLQEGDTEFELYALGMRLDS
jgi:heme-degrading monooxygenase HmoA